MNTFKFGGGMFYMSDGGETIGFAPYPIDQVFTLEEPEYADDFKTLVNPKEFLGEITLTCTMDYRTYLSLYHGRKVTNNWLKMQGGIMTRKTRRRGLKLKH